MKRNSALFITKAAVIAALYFALSMLSNAVGLCSGVIQCRISEALTILPAFLVEAIPGLAIGCLLTNIITSATIWDIIFGTGATLIGAIGTYLIGRLVRERALSSSVNMKSGRGILRIVILTALFALPPIVSNAGPQIRPRRTGRFLVHLCDGDGRRNHRLRHLRRNSHGCAFGEPLHAGTSSQRR